MAAISGRPNRRLKQSPDQDIDEIHEELKKLDTQQEFLKLYPLGYTVFDVDFVTGSVTPEQAKQGLEAYEFDYRSVRIIENTPSQIRIQLPDVLKSHKLLLSKAVIGGDKKTMQTYGAGYGFYDSSTSILGIGRVLTYSGSTVVWIFGLQYGPRAQGRPLT